ncbi:MAG: BTAD domain-containing putative transcriptional regulator [Caldilineaceae bacterium]
MSTHQTRATLELSLLGTPQVILAGKSLTDLPIKTQALLFYLAVTRQPHPRTTLATLLWGELPEENARSNLRKAIQQLRATLPDHFHSDRHSAVLHTDGRLWVDAVAFEERVAQAQKRADHSALEQAVQLYRADFLAGFFVRNAPDFEAWQLTQRERLREKMVEALETLTQYWAAQDDFARAIAVTRRLLTVEPWREAAHHQLMELLVRNNERTAALAHFAICRDALRQELDVEPSAATHELVARIRAETLLQANSAETILLPSQRAHRVHSHKSVATAVEFPLMGREQEWQAIKKVWQQLSQPHFLCIGGEAGIGKTRLAEELLLLAEREGAAVGRTRSHALQGQLAYGPVTDWLRAAPLQAALAELDDLRLTELTRLLPELLIERPELPTPEPLQERWQRARFFDALEQAFAAVDGRLLLVLDDLQWSDADTLDWLQYLVERGSTKLLVVGTVRSDEIDAAHPLHHVRRQLQRHDRFTQLDIAPLSATATTALATQVAQQPLADDAAARLFDDTAGNPLFVIESMRADPAKAVVTSLPMYPENISSQEQRFVPAKIYSVIQARLAQLSPQAQRLAQFGAAIGRAFDLPLLAKASAWDNEAVLTLLDELWQRRIVKEVDGVQFDFAHDRIRDVTYAEISPIQRRLLHHKIASALEMFYKGNLEAVSGQLAVHCEAAGLYAQAIGFYQRTADQSRKLYAHQAAVKSREKALSVLQQLPETIETQRTKIDLLIALGEDRTAQLGKGHPLIAEDLRRAHQLMLDAGTPMQQLNVLIALTAYARVCGRWANAYELAIQVIDAATEVGDAVLISYGRFGAAEALTRQGCLMEAHTYFEQIQTMASSGNAEDGYTDGHSGYMTRSAYCLWLLGFPEQAKQRGAQGLEMGRRLHPKGLVVWLHQYSSILLFCKDIAAVDRLSAELITVAKARNDDFSVGWGNIYRGWLLIQQGNLVDGIQVIRENLETHHALGNRFYECVWRSLLAEAYIQLSQVDAALRELDQALAFAQEGSDHHWDAYLLKLKGDCLLAMNRSPVAVEQQYQLAIDIARRQHARSLELRAAMGLCRLWQSQGKVTAAHQLLSTIYGWFTEGFDTTDLVAARELLEELAA